MFFNKKLIQENKELNGEVAELKREVLRLKDSLTRVQTTLSAAQSDVSKSEFAFDFSAVNAFSIERNINDGVPVTVIGYTIGGEVKEWYLYCNQERHSSLVKEFSKSRNTSGKVKQGLLPLGARESE